MRPILHPHLFKLHSQGAKLAGQKNKQHSDFNLDLDSQEALQEHIYHAYGEWDNTYNMGKLVMGTAHKFASGFTSSDLLPPPPLINSSQFMSDPMLTSQNVQNLGTSGNVLAHGGLSSSKVSLATSNASVMSNHNTDQHLQEHVHTEACFKTVKSNRSLLNSTTSTTTKPKVNMNPTTNHQHVDHCFQHNPFLHTHHNSYSTSPQSSPPMVSASGGTVPHGRKSYFPELKQLRKDGTLPPNGCPRANNLHLHGTNNSNLQTLSDQPTNNQSHSNNFSRRFFSDPKQPLNAKDGLGGVGAMANGCQHPSMHFHPPNNQASGPPINNNSGSGGSSPPCHEADCDGHHEDNDSIDDSCSGNY